jgi:hypothetical protein
MARYKLVVAVYIDAIGRKLVPGTTIASDSGSALPGDLVLPALCVPPAVVQRYSAGTPAWSQLVPLDAAGVAALVAAGLANAAIGMTPFASATGADGVSP